METSWTPSTHHQVPQPAGKECADWYTRVQPSAEEILYGLAHTKGERDALAKALFEVIDAVCGLDHPWDLQDHGIEAKRAEEICELAELGKPS